MDEKKMPEEKKLTFEEKEKRIDEIISKLQKDDKLSLKQTADLYNEGKRLLAELDRELDETKKSVSNEIVKD